VNIQNGKSYRIFFSEGNLNNGCIHVRGIIDNDIIIYRDWSKRKQRWCYRADDSGLLEKYFKEGYLIPMAKS